MNRHDLFKSIRSLLEDMLVICNIGMPSQELYSLGDANNFFYMLGSMGMCSSIGVGLSLGTNESVVAIDGDGSVLMNLGSLATIANHAPTNFILLIVDNGCYGSTGDQPTFSSKLTSLAGIAEAAGCPNVYECTGVKTAGILVQAKQQAGPHVIVSKIEPGNCKSQVIDLSPIWIRDRFRARIQHETVS